MGFEVLFVCTGNICRSPSAERLLAARLRPGLPVTVGSAGTGALVGRGIDEPTALALRRRGADPDHHRARLLTRELLAGAGLILSAESAHRSAIMQAEPISFRRTFTIREFGRLGAGLPPLPAPVTADALHDRVAEVAGRRGRVEVPVDPGADDIGDPFGAGLAVAADTVARVAAAVDAVLGALGLAGPGPGREGA